MQTGFILLAEESRETINVPTAGAGSSVDRFRRNVAAGFGTSDVGRAWTTLRGGSANTADFSVVNQAAQGAGSGFATVTCGTAATGRFAFYDTGGTTGILTAQFQLGITPVGAPQQYSIQIRQTSNTDYYRINLTHATDGTASYTVEKVAASSIVATGNVVNMGAVTGGSDYILKLLCDASGNLSGMCWLASGGQPSSWQSTLVESGSMLTDTNVGIRSQANTSNTTLPTITWRWIEFQALNNAAAPAPSLPAPVNITVLAQPAMAPNHCIFDPFVRSAASNGWGTSFYANGNTSSVWSVLQGASSGFATTGTQATITTVGAGSATAHSIGAGLTVQDAELVTRVKFGQTSPSGANINVQALGRWVDSNNFIRPGIILDTANDLTVELRTIVSGVSTLHASAVIQTNYVATDYYWIKTRAINDHIWLKVWKDGTTEPAYLGGDVTASSFGTDTASILAVTTDLSSTAGDWGARNITNASYSGTLTSTWDNFRVTNPFKEAGAMPITSGAAITGATNNFEGQANTTALTTGNSGGASGNAFNTVTLGATGAVTFSSADPAHASNNGRFAVGGTGASNPRVSWNSSTLGTMTNGYGRAYIKTTFSVGTPSVLVFGALSGANKWFIGLNSSGQIQLLGSTSAIVGTSTASITASTYFRIEWQHDATNQLIVRLYTSMDSTTITETVTASSLTNSNIDEIYFGDNSAASGHVTMMDDVNAGATAWPGPYGATVTILDQPSIKVTVLPAAATSTAAAPVPNVAVPTNITISPSPATATAAGQQPIIKVTGIPPPATLIAGAMVLNILSGDNSDFEGGVGSWTGTGNVTLSSSTTVALVGTHSLKVVSS